jgi:hypothetical protein
VERSVWNPRDFVQQVSGIIQPGVSAIYATLAILNVGNPDLVAGQFAGLRPHDPADHAEPRTTGAVEKVLGYKAGD